MWEGRSPASLTLMLPRPAFSPEEFQKGSTMLSLSAPSLYTQPSSRKRSMGRFQTPRLLKIFFPFLPPSVENTTMKKIERGFIAFNFPENNTSTCSLHKIHKMFLRASELALLVRSPAPT